MKVLRGKLHGTMDLVLSPSPQSSPARGEEDKVTRSKLRLDRLIRGRVS
jgi:hypothetical protein